MVFPRYVPNFGFGWQQDDESPTEVPFGVLMPSMPNIHFAQANGTTQYANDPSTGLPLSRPLPGTPTVPQDYPRPTQFGQGRATGGMRQPPTVSQGPLPSGSQAQSALPFSQVLPGFGNPLSLDPSTVPTRRQIEDQIYKGTPFPGTSSRSSTSPKTGTKVDQEEERPFGGKPADLMKRLTTSSRLSAIPPELYRYWLALKESTQIPFEGKVEGGSVSNNWDKYFKVKAEGKVPLTIGDLQAFFNGTASYNANPKRGEPHISLDKIGGGINFPGGWEASGYYSPRDRGWGARLGLKRSF